MPAPKPKKLKPLKFDRLGMALGRDPKKLEFINYANESKPGSTMLFGRSCGRVDFVFPQFVGRMTADDAETLGNQLLEAAKEARAAALSLQEDAMEYQSAGAR